MIEVFTNFIMVKSYSLNHWFEAAELFKDENAHYICLMWELTEAPDLDLQDFIHCSANRCRGVPNKVLSMGGSQLLQNQIWLKMSHFKCYFVYSLHLVSKQNLLSAETYYTAPISHWGFYMNHWMLWHVQRWCNVFVLPLLWHVPHFGNICGPANFMHWKPWCVCPE